MTNNDRFAQSFEEITQTWYFVGVCRFKDVRNFNYQVTSKDTNIVGITDHIDYIEIQNSVDLSFRIGRIGVLDNVDLRKILPLMGNEVLYIEYTNTQAAKVSTNLKKSGFFRVMSVEENTNSQQQNPSLRLTSRFLTLTIAEFPYVDILTFNKSDKTYKWGDDISTSNKQSISTYVNDMFIDPTSREVTTSMGISVSCQKSADIKPDDMINYYSPTWSKLKNINFLKRMATTLVGNHSYYYLNCEADKINFKSIYSDFLDINKNTNKIEFVPSEFYNMVDSYDVSPRDISNVLMDVSFKTGNTIDAMFSGLSGSTYFSFDYLTGHIFTAVDYNNFKKATDSNNKYYLYFQKFGNQRSESMYSPFTSPTIIQNIKNYDYAKKSFNSMICEATTFITNGRYLGQMANIITPNASRYTEEVIDSFKGKDWCIWGYRDIISNQRGICKLILKKDTTWLANNGLYGTMAPGN